MDTKRPGGLRRLIGNSFIVSAGILVSPAEGGADSAGSATVELDRTDQDDEYALGLSRLDPFDATNTAALAATSCDRTIRRWLARSLAIPFPLVGDALILEHLASDPDEDVRLAARHALAIRFQRSGRT